MSPSSPEVFEPERGITLQLSSFAWDALTEQGSLMGVSKEELAIFAIMYYLADVDSGRIARDVRRSQLLEPSVDAESRDPSRSG